MPNPELEVRLRWEHLLTEIVDFEENLKAKYPDGIPSHQQALQIAVQIYGPHGLVAESLFPALFKLWGLSFTVPQIVDITARMVREQFKKEHAQWIAAYPNAKTLLELMNFVKAERDANNDDDPGLENCLGDLTILATHFGNEFPISKL